MEELEIKNSLKVSKLLSQFLENEVLNKLDLNVGWFLIRASNTENSLILRIDGNTKENFVNLSKEVDALLKSEKIIVNYISQV